MLVYVDDGHPESRDYADNYVRVEPRSLFRSLLGLPPRLIAIQASVIAAALVFIWTRPSR